MMVGIRKNLEKKIFGFKNRAKKWLGVIPTVWMMNLYRFFKCSPVRTGARSVALGSDGLVLENLDMLIVLTPPRPLEHLKFINCMS